MHYSIGGRFVHNSPSNILKSNNVSLWFCYESEQMENLKNHQLFNGSFALITSTFSTKCVAL